MAYILIFLIEAITSFILALILDLVYMALTGVETVSMDYTIIIAVVICGLMQIIKIVKFIIRKREEEE